MAVIGHSWIKYSMIWKESWESWHVSVSMPVGFRYPEILGHSTCTRVKDTEPSYICQMRTSIDDERLNTPTNIFLVWVKRWATYGLSHILRIFRVNVLSRSHHCEGTIFFFNRVINSQIISRIHIQLRIKPDFYIPFLNLRKQKCFFIPQSNIETFFILINFCVLLVSVILIAVFFDNTSMKPNTLSTIFFYTSYGTKYNGTNNFTCERSLVPKFCNTNALWYQCCFGKQLMVTIIFNTNHF